MMPRTRWPKERVFRLGFLVGRGFKPAEIAVDPLIVSTVHTVRTMTNNMGGAFSDVPSGLMIDMPGKLLAALGDQARKRRQTTEALAATAMRILADDPVLLANVLDDA